MTYLVKFDKETGLFLARSQEFPLIAGSGKSLYVAIDDLETNVKRKMLHSPKLDATLTIQEKNAEIEVLTKISVKSPMRL